MRRRQGPRRSGVAVGARWREPRPNGDPADVAPPEIVPDDLEETASAALQIGFEKGILDGQIAEPIRSESLQRGGEVGAQRVTRSEQGSAKSRRADGVSLVEQGLDEPLVFRQAVDLIGQRSSSRLISRRSTSSS